MRVGQILDGFMIVVTLRIAMFCCLDRETSKHGRHNNNSTCDIAYY